MPTISPLLSFQRQILDNLLDEDALCIVARGLGLNRILAELSRICATPRALVFLINASDQDESDLEQQFMQLRSGEGHVDEPTQLYTVNNETNSAARARLYRQGGLVSVTSRILIVDFLNKLVPAQLVTGIIVHNASRVSAESIEAFVLRVARQQNPHIFVKALSDTPEAFTLGFAPVEKTLKELGLRHVHLWPRFHVEVQRDLSTTEVPVVELRQPQTRAMEELQQAVLDCLSAMISELSSSTKLLDPESINVESCLFRYFDAMVKRMLAPYWHRLSLRTRTMVGDLASLRKIAEFVTAYDCVSLLKYLDTLLIANRPAVGIAGGMGTASVAEWLASDAANILYSVARTRVFRTSSSSSSSSDSNGRLRISDECKRKLRSFGLPETIFPVLEVPPKLKLLETVLEEIGVGNHVGAHKANEADPCGPVLIMAASAKECRMIRTYLSLSGSTVCFDSDRANKAHGSDETDSKHPRMMVDLLRGFFKWKASMTGQRSGQSNTSGNKAPAAPAAQPSTSNTQQSARINSSNGQMRRPPPAKRRRVRGGSATAGSGVSRAPADTLEEETNEIAAFAGQAKEEDGLGDNTADSAEHNSDYESDDDVLLETTFDEHFGMLPSNEAIFVHSYYACGNQAGNNILEVLQPTHIIMYDPDPAFIRLVEVYQATGRAPLKQVYFMVYDNSLEEQRYLSAIRRERESFEKLIREKAALVIPIDDTFGMSPANSMVMQAIARRSNRNARVPLASEIQATSPLVVVDVREFRSPLPSLLHAAGYEVVPRTIDIGDYVLHDELVVERKSLPDLIGSLRSGRLYNQAAAMTKHYRFAALLVEFEVNTSFSLQAIGGIAQNVSLGSIHSQLAILALAFPRLRILWSSSPYETVNIFAELKRDSDEEPDVDRAVSMGQGDHSVERESIYNANPIALLQSLPGVTVKNYQLLARKYGNIRELCGASKVDLSAVIGEEGAGKLYDFIQTNTKS
ncbi:DNA repair protein RAD16 [Coemansia sp. RSA 1813]|nr:DNA repair protein RAD16 [Coemansia sp. RSA 487]KAJ2565271.1 DNA repair protein RAD16 [Coemansia sp. RSA 1813]